jgi:hypothetical protein
MLAFGFMLYLFRFDDTPLPALTIIPSAGKKNFAGEPAKITLPPRGNESVLPWGFSRLCQAQSFPVLQPQPVRPGNSVQYCQ